MENSAAYDDFCEKQAACAREQCGNGPNSFTVVYDRADGVYAAVHGRYCSSNCAVYSISDACAQPPQ
jgi:hypothetical protein